MAARLPGLRGLLLAGCLLRSAEAQSGPDSTATHVISAETIRAAGVTRLSEVLSLSPRWQVATVEGFTWDASPLGGDPFGPTRWLVLVDGRHMDLDLLGSSNLDRLGIPLDRIATVELIDVPRLEAGQLTTAGIVHIHTTTPNPGPSATGWFSTGSEIGDPGPFAFTPGSTTNVDRLGHEASAGLAYAGAGWFAEASIAVGQIIASDPAIVDRYTAALGSPPRLELQAPMLRGGVRLGGGMHELLVVHSRADGALALRPAVSELATREHFTYAGVIGKLPAGSGRELTYELGHTWNSARAAAGGALPFDWKARTASGRVELRMDSSPLRVAGLRMRRIEAFGGPATLATAYAELGSFATGALTVGTGEVGLAAALRRDLNLARAVLLRGTVAYERVPEAETNDLYRWTERGYPLLASAGGDLDVVGSRAPAERATADLAWRVPLGRGVTASARALVRVAWNLSLSRQALRPPPPGGSLTGPATLRHDQRGSLWGGSAAIDAQISEALRASLSYRHVDVLGGGDPFREVWETVPRHAAAAELRLAAAPGLEFRVAATYRGPSRWADFQAVADETLSDALLLDLAAQKWLWHRKLRAHFAVRNALGADLRYHPAGATFAPTAVLQLEAGLP